MSISEGQEPDGDASAVSDVWTIVVHGGVLPIEGLTEIQIDSLKAGLRSALQAGAAVLASRGDSLDAVEAAVRVLEDDAQFNAGRGAVMNLDGIYELDAAIMSGKTGAAGGVAGLRTIKNPITLARALMNDGRHILLAGEGAERFAAGLTDDKKVEFVSQDYFFDEAMFAEIQQAREAVNLPPLTHPSKRPSHGTVGAVALDCHGNLAAATSTGGRTQKLPGRIGDSPIVGAGNYAENGVVAASGTGKGEEYIRHSATAQVAWFIKYLGLSPDEAVKRVMNQVLPPSAGGMIAVGSRGEVVMEFTTTAMSRGFAKSDGALEAFVARTQ